jgi:histidinol dehydrogenase
VRGGVGQRPRFAEKQLPRESTANFSSRRAALGQIVRPLDTVAAYIPAGRYPLPSTLIMTAVPAQVAGVKNICVACPKPVDEVLERRTCSASIRYFRWAARRPSRLSPIGTKDRASRRPHRRPGNIYVAAAKKACSPAKSGSILSPGPPRF